MAALLVLGGPAATVSAKPSTATLAPPFVSASADLTCSSRPAESDGSCAVYGTANPANGDYSLFAVVERGELNDGSAVSASSEPFFIATDRLRRATTSQTYAIGVRVHDSESQVEIKGPPCLGGECAEARSLTRVTVTARHDACETCTASASQEITRAFTSGPTLGVPAFDIGYGSNLDLELQMTMLDSAGGRIPKGTVTVEVRLAAHSYERIPTGSTVTAGSAAFGRVMSVTRL